MAPKFDEAGYSTPFLIADHYKDIMNDISVQADAARPVFSKDGGAPDPNWSLRWDDNQTVDWTPIHHLLDTYDETTKAIMRVDKEGSDADGEWHVWTTCLPFTTAALLLTPEQPTEKKTWASVIKGTATTENLKIQGTPSHDLASAATKKAKVTPIRVEPAREVAGHIASGSGSQNRGQCAEKTTAVHEKLLGNQEPKIADAAVDEKAAQSPLAVEMVQTVLQGGPSASKIVLGQIMTFEELAEMVRKQNAVKVESWHVVGKKGKTTPVTPPLNSETAMPHAGRSNAKQANWPAKAKRAAKAFKAKVQSCFGHQANETPVPPVPVGEGVESDVEASEEEQTASETAAAANNDDALSLGDSPNTTAAKLAEFDKQYPAASVAPAAAKAAQPRANAARPAAAAKPAKAKAATKPTTGGTASTAATANARTPPTQTGSAGAGGSGLDPNRDRRANTSEGGTAAASQPRVMPADIDEALDDCIQRARQGGQNQSAHTRRESLRNMNAEQLEQEAKALAKLQARHERKAKEIAESLAEAHALLADPDTIMQSEDEHRDEPVDARNEPRAYRGNRGRSQSGHHSKGSGRGPSANRGAHHGVKRSNNHPRGADLHMLGKMFGQTWNKAIHQKVDKAAEAHQAEMERREREANEKRKAKRGRTTCQPARGHKKPADRRSPPPGFRDLAHARTMSVNAQRYGGHSAAPSVHDAPDVSDAPDASDAHDASAALVDSSSEDEQSSISDCESREHVPRVDTYEQQVKHVQTYSRRKQAIQRMRELKTRIDRLDEGPGGYQKQKRKQLDKQIRQTTQVLHATGLELGIEPWSDVIDCYNLALFARSYDTSDDEATKDSKSREHAEMCELAQPNRVNEQPYGGPSATPHVLNAMDTNASTLELASTPDCHAQVTARHTFETRQAVAKQLGIYLQQRDEMNTAAQQGKGNPAKLKKLNRNIATLRKTIAELSAELQANTAWQEQNGTGPVAENTEHKCPTEPETVQSGTKMQSIGNKTATAEAMRLMGIKTVHTPAKPRHHTDPVLKANNSKAMQAKLQTLTQGRLKWTRFVRHSASTLVEISRPANSTTPDAANETAVNQKVGDTNARPATETTPNGEEPETADSTNEDTTTQVATTVELNSTPNRVAATIRKWLRQRWPGCKANQVPPATGVETNPTLEAKRRAKFKADQQAQAQTAPPRTWMGYNLPAQVWNGTERKAWNWLSKRRTPTTTPGPVGEAREDETPRWQLNGSVGGIRSRGFDPQQLDMSNPHTELLNLSPIGNAAAGPLGRSASRQQRSRGTTPPSTSLSLDPIGQAAAGPLQPASTPTLGGATNAAGSYRLPPPPDRPRSRSQPRAATPPQQSIPRETHMHGEIMEYIRLRHPEIFQQAQDQAMSTGATHTPDAAIGSSQWPPWQTQAEIHANSLTARQPRMEVRHPPTPEAHGNHGTEAAQIAFPHHAAITTLDQGNGPTNLGLPNQPANGNGQHAHYQQQAHATPHVQLTTGVQNAVQQTVAANWQQHTPVAQQTYMPHQQGGAHSASQYAKELLKGAVKKQYDPSQPAATHAKDNVKHTPDLDEFESYIRNHQIMGNLNDQITANVLIASCAVNLQDRLQQHMSAWQQGTGHTLVEWALKLLREQNPHQPRTASSIRHQIQNLVGTRKTFAEFTAQFLKLRTELTTVLKSDEYNNGALIRDFFLPRLSQEIAKQWKLTNMTLATANQFSEMEW
jgi:hypothetical protein